MPGRKLARPGRPRRSTLARVLALALALAPTRARLARRRGRRRRRRELGPAPAVFLPPPPRLRSWSRQMIGAGAHAGRLIDPPAGANVRRALFLPTRPRS